MNTSRLITIVLAAIFMPISAYSQKLIPKPPQQTDLVVIAHGDDWQIFAGDVIADYLERGDEVMLVQVTIGAGDYKCWEKGFIASVVTAIDGTVKTLSCDSDIVAPAQCVVVPFPNHSVKQCTYRNSAMYFLHLPATFCPFCGHQLEGLARDGKTLLNFYLGKTGPLSTRDAPPPEVYSDWADLTATITWIYNTHFLLDEKGKILVKRYGDILSIEPHGVVRVFPMPGIPNVSTDHLDHGVAGCAAIDVYRRMLAQHDTPGLVLFRGYDSVLKPPNTLSDGRFEKKRRLFVDAFAGTTKGNALGTEGANADFYKQRMERTIIEEHVERGTGSPHQGCEWLGTIGFPN